MTTRKTVLVIGLTNAPSGAPAEIVTEGGAIDELRERLVSQVRQAHDAGYDLEMKQFRPEDLETTAPEWVKERLGSQHWDGLIVGFGVRGIPACTEFFEEVINAARTITPGTKLGFNTKPDDVLEAVKRLG